MSGSNPRLGTSLHMSGSCVMGAEADPFAVVDGRCRVDRRARTQYC